MALNTARLPQNFRQFFQQAAPRLSPRIRGVILTMSEAPENLLDSSGLKNHPPAHQLSLPAPQNERLATTITRCFEK